MAATVKELRYNLARDYADARHVVEAIPIFEALWSPYPDESRFGIKLFESQLALGRPAEARQALEKLVREKQRYALEAQEELKRLNEEWKDKKPEDLKQDQQRQLNKLRKKAGVNPAAFAYLRGSLLHAEGDHKQALEELQKAEQVQMHNRPSLYQKMGEVLLSLKCWDELGEVVASQQAMLQWLGREGGGLSERQLGGHVPAAARRRAAGAGGPSRTGECADGELP